MRRAHKRIRHFATSELLPTSNAERLKDEQPNETTDASFICSALKSLQNAGGVVLNKGGRGFRKEGKD